MELSDLLPDELLAFYSQWHNDIVDSAMVRPCSREILDLDPQALPGQGQYCMAGVR